MRMPGMEAKTLMILTSDIEACSHTLMLKLKL